MNEKKSLLSQLAIDRDEEPPRGISVGIVVLLVLVALVAGTGAGVYLLAPTSGAPSGPSRPVTAEKTPQPQDAPTTTSAPVKPERASRETGGAILDASGYVTAYRMATVSAELTGRITEVLVEEGMTVEEGQILARLDDAVARVSHQRAAAQVRAARAQVDSAEARHAEAQRVLDRVSALKTRDFSSEAALTSSRFEVENSKAALARARAEVAVAEWDVAFQQERLADHIIRAPFPGVVTIKNAQPGEIVAPGSAGGGFTRTGICTIVDMSSLELEADVNEAFIGRIYPGQRVEANLDAYPDWDIPASVLAIIPTANRDKATVRVRIKLEVTDPRILPEMGVRMTFYE